MCRFNLLWCMEGQNDIFFKMGIHSYILVTVTVLSILVFFACFTGGNRLSKHRAKTRFTGKISNSTDTRRRVNPKPHAWQRSSKSMDSNAAPDVIEDKEMSVNYLNVKLRILRTLYLSKLKHSVKSRVPELKEQMSEDVSALKQTKLSSSSKTSKVINDDKHLLKLPSTVFQDKKNRITRSINSLKEMKAILARFVAYFTHWKAVNKPRTTTTTSTTTTTTVRTTTTAPTTTSRAKPVVLFDHYVDSFSCRDSHGYPCSHLLPCTSVDRYYCLNGGTCVIVGVLDVKTCR